MERPHNQCYWVESNRFLAGEYPGDKEDLQMKEKIGKLLDFGVNYFLDLTEPIELIPYERTLKKEAERRGLPVTYRRLPIQDISVPKSRDEMLKILDTLEKALIEDRLVYLHCWGGVGRTGTVVGCYLVRYGLSGDEALRQIDSWWQTVAKSKRIKRSPETSEQMDYVRRWDEGA
jgi:hypothetical protein